MDNHELRDRNIPEDFVQDMILKMPSKNIMNSLARSRGKAT